MISAPIWAAGRARAVGGDMTKSDRNRYPGLAVKSVAGFPLMDRARSDFGPVAPKSLHRVLFVSSVGVDAASERWPSMVRDFKEDRADAGLKLGRKKIRMHRVLRFTHFPLYFHYEPVVSAFQLLKTQRPPRRPLRAAAQAELPL